ncbi:MAG: ABC-F type ribosomal protection protein [Solobacterium sp.]|nr:ABC-F type ribosomal protection protein [Solobacterium sp.]
MRYQVSQGKKAFGSDVVFEDVQFFIKANEKIAIVGRNGCGKTTFLKCMSGAYPFDGGTISIASGTTIGYLSQQQIEEEGLTVEEVLEKVYEPLFVLEEKMHLVEEKMKEDSDEKLLAQYASLQEQYEALNGYQWESEMQTVFTRFGFTKEDLKKPVNTFSGGQKTRIAFVRLLLSKPDILLLDEPTNHLDLETIQWLEGYVKNYPKAVVMVSHDRMFLDRTVDVVYDLEYGKMTRYVGNYTHYVNEKRNQIARQEAAYVRQQKEIERLEELIEKFRYKKNKAAFAQSKIKYLERMDKVEKISTDEKTFHAHFKPRLKGGENVLTVDHLQIGYDSTLCEVSFTLHRQDRLAIIGPNGTGKSTLVKTLMNLVEPKGGHYLFGHQIETGYFDQQLAQFSSGKTVLEELWDAYPDLDRTTVRSVLGQFLFSADDVFKTVDVLSGGEKVRLSLAKLLLQHSNLLILDEPTNHLDIPGKEALEDALRDFSGTLLFVSHDRYFIQQLATKLLIIENDGSTKLVDKTYQEYMEDEKKVEETQTPVKKEASKKPPMSQDSLRREIAKIEKEITAKEEELEAKRALRFEEEYYQDYRKMNALDEEIDDIHNELAHLYEKWELFSEQSLSKS